MEYASSVDYKILFNALPGASALLLPDAPNFTVVASTDEFAEFARLPKSKTIGLSLFEVFPDNPNGPKMSNDICSSLTKCLQDKKVNELEAQRYDIANGEGNFQEMYWKVIHTPILNEDGAVEFLIHTAVDVTDRMLMHRKDATIKSFEPTYNMFMQSAMAIHIFSGPDHIVTLANAPTLKIWGKGQDVLGKPLREVLPELHSQSYFEIIEKVRLTGKPYNAHEALVVLQRDGKNEICYFNFVLQPYYDAANEPPSGVIAMVHEVTEIVNNRNIVAEKERNLDSVINQNMQRLKSLIDSAPFPIGVYIGKEMRIEMVNQAILDAWDRDWDVIGKRYAEVLPEIDGQGPYEQLDRVFTTGEAFHAHNQHIDLHVDGKLQTYYFNYSFTPLFDTDGKVYGVMNTAADVTDLNLAQKALRESERNFRTMILQAPVAMCLLHGPLHTVEIANASMIELWGKSEEAVMYKPIFEGLPDAKSQGLEELLKNVYQTGETYTANEREITLFRNGQYDTTYQNFVYESYRDANGDILGILAISIDVTQQVLARQKIEDVVKERTAALEQANLRLQNSNAELEQFAYIASHDLQEPLRKINMFTGMLDDSIEETNQRARKQLQSISNSAKRMMNLITDILGYSQLSRKNEAFSMVNLEDICSESIADFDMVIEEKNAVVHCSGLGKIEAIPLQMVQLFHNLISNALKYNRPNVAPEVTISGKILSDGESKNLGLPLVGVPYCQLSFKDNGIGFPQEYAERIFNIFQRLHGKGQYEGTGIGLAMCKKIAENHHGIIFAEGGEGSGATFTVVIPTAQVKSTGLS